MQACIFITLVLCIVCAAQAKLLPESSYYSSREPRGSVDRFSRPAPKASSLSFESDDSGESDAQENARALTAKKQNKFCQPQEFIYYIRDEHNKLQMAKSRWKRARAGQSASLQELCLKSNGATLIRRCLYDVKTNSATWENIAHWGQVECLQHVRQHIVTPQLNIIHEQILVANASSRSNKQKRKDVANSVVQILTQPNHQIIPADVQLTNQILLELSADVKDAELTPELLSICDTIMSTDRQVLRISADSNSTNAFLDNFESYIDEISNEIVDQAKCGQHSVSSTSLYAANSNLSSFHLVQNHNLANMGISIHVAANVSIFFVNPACASISGVAVFTTGLHNQADHRLQHDEKGNFHYRFIYMNETIESIMHEQGLELAAFIPSSLWQHIQQSVASKKSLLKPPVIVFKIYCHDALFVEQQLIRARRPFSKVLSISVPHFEGTFPENLPFILRNQYYQQNTIHAENTPGTGCGYWNYSSWISIEQLNQNSGNSEIIQCSTPHLTQFAFLVGGNFRQSDVGKEVIITELHQTALDVITLVGCSLSLLGLIGIWLTAVVQRSWRAQSSTKILLHLCVALTLQMILFVFVNTDNMAERLISEQSYGKCIALGALLQYSILVMFSWMLIVAFLQFQRYVTIIGIERPSHYILKSAIAAWGFPLIPTLLVVFIDPHSYIPSSYQLEADTGVCYPSGHALHFGVVLPICLIVIANLTIFIYVFYSISHTLSQSIQRHEKLLVIKQIRLSILLFFLLGLSWIFGILAFMQAGIAFSYLFCMTATLQGFVLFIYFVLLDAAVRKKWAQILHIGAKTKKQKEKASETQTMSTSNTNL